jgi:5-methylcytosine-specific restriction endonuclease McrA
MNNAVLLLNANGSPISWLPISAISWQNAIRLIWLDVVEVLHVYEDWKVHSPSMTIEVPSVVMLRKQVTGFRNWVAKEDAPQAHLVYLRDLYTCQYCLKRFTRQHLTIDHVVPKVYGGRTQWSNVSTCCSPCNSRRGCDTRIRPATKPFRPSANQLIKNMRKFPIHVPSVNWNLYLNWSPELVQVSHKYDGIVINEDFEAENEDFENKRINILTSL